MLSRNMLACKRKMEQLTQDLEQWSFSFNKAVLEPYKLSDDIQKPVSVKFEEAAIHTNTQDDREYDEEYDDEDYDDEYNEDEERYGNEEYDEDNEQDYHGEDEDEYYPENEDYPDEDNDEEENYENGEYGETGETEDDTEESPKCMPASQARTEHITTVRLVTMISAMNVGMICTKTILSSCCRKIKVPRVIQKPYKMHPCIKL